MKAEFREFNREWIKTCSLCKKHFGSDSLEGLQNIFGLNNQTPDRMPSSCKACRSTRTKNKRLKEAKESRKRSLEASKGSEEEWRMVLGYPGYDASSKGRIRSWWKRGWGTLSVKRPAIMSCCSNRGYRQVHTRQGVAKVHKLVLLAFSGPKPTGHEVAHLNGDRTDNRPTNLQWVTAKENCQHRILHGTAPRWESIHSAKLNWDNVKEIRKIHNNNHRGYKKTARKFGVAPSTISSVVNRWSWIEEVSK